MKNLQGQTKVCTKCGEEQPLTDFHKNRQAKDGLSHSCKSCCKVARTIRYALNSEKERRLRRQYRRENLATQRQYDKLYYKENLEKSKAHSHNRRARKANAKGSFTAKQFAAKVEAYGNKCYYCGKPHEGTPHADHFISLSQGGSNEIDNIVPACPKCNLSKGKKMPWEFKQGETYSPKLPEQLLLERIS